MDSTRFIFLVCIGNRHYENKEIVDNKNLNKIIHLSANSLQKSRYSNEAKATFSTLAKVDITTNGICIFEKEMATKSRI